MKKQADVTLVELYEQSRTAHRIEISRSRLWYWLRDLGLRHKKTLRAQEQDRAEKPVATGVLVGTAL